MGDPRRDLRDGAKWPGPMSGRSAEVSVCRLVCTCGAGKGCGQARDRQRPRALYPVSPPIERQMDAAPDRPGPGGFWHTAAEALRGSQQDYTRGSVRRAILLLAVPMVLEMALESVF